ncbi:MAG: hypothetical protein KAG97_10085, partial [Victivallales bacterium]|nr:hypothetical protein [Victivallales bacterium]
MRYLIRKNILLISLLAIAILSLAGGYAGYTYYMAASGKAEIAAPKFTITPSKKIKLGDLVTAVATLKCPWGHIPDKATLSVAKSLQVVSEPVIRKTGNFWGSSLWRIETRIQPYRTESVGKSECEIRIRSSKNGRSSFKTVKSVIPGFKVLAVDTSKSKGLYIAREARETTVTERNPWIIPIIAAISLVGAVVFLILWLRKRKTILESVVLPPWTLAL